MKLKKIDSKEVRKEIIERVEKQSIELPELCYLIRRMLNKTQADFGTLVGASNKTINELENGKKIPSIKILNEILAIAGLEIGIRSIR